MKPAIVLYRPKMVNGRWQAMLAYRTARGETVRVLVDVDKALSDRIADAIMQQIGPHLALDRAQQSITISGESEVGLSLNPVKALKKAVKAVAKGAQAVVSTTEKAVKSVPIAGDAVKKAEEIAKSSAFKQVLSVAAYVPSPLQPIAVSVKQGFLVRDTAQSVLAAAGRGDIKAATAVALTGIAAQSGDPTAIKLSAQFNDIMGQAEKLKKLAEKGGKIVVPGGSRLMTSLEMADLYKRLRNM